MSSSKEDEEFWNSTEKRSFSFETNESDNLLFGVSVTGAARLRSGISNIQVSDKYFKPDEPQWNLKPLLSIISDRTLAQLLAANKSQYVPDESPDVREQATLKQILLGQPCSLERYKSLTSKTSLLDAAIKSGDGNAILAVTQFIAKTLKRSLLQRLLAERPEAVDAYLRYLSTRMQTNEICDILTMQGQNNGAAMRSLLIILKNNNNVDTLLRKLTNCQKTQFANLTDCREIAFVQAYINLLEWQMAVKDLQFSESFELNLSVLDCLRHTCRDHWNSQEGSLVSPMSFSRTQGISSRQFQKVALVTRASVQAWDDIDGLLHKKGWLGGKKLQSNLSIEEILKLLKDCQAPIAILDKFLGYIDNTKKRLQTARSLYCYKSVIDILTSQGDRTSLLEYKASLPPQSEQYFYADHALCNSSIKWRN